MDMRADILMHFSLYKYSVERVVLVYRYVHVCRWRRGWVSVARLVSSALFFFVARSEGRGFAVPWSRHRSAARHEAAAARPSGL